jgi:hypothetical protein
MCPTCGERLPIIVSVTTAGQLLIPKHACSRFLVAEYWHHGKRLDIESSEFPNITGKQHLVRLHEQTASVDGWQPPAGRQGWTAYWVNVKGETE